MVCRSVSLPVSRSAIWSVGLTVGLLVCQSAILPVGLSIILLVSPSVSLPVGLLVSQTASQSVCRSVCQSVCPLSYWSVSFPVSPSISLFVCSIRLSVYIFFCFLHCCNLEHERTYVRCFFRKSIIDDFNDGHLSLKASHHKKSITTELFAAYDLYANSSL